MGDGGEIKAVRGWWQQNYGLSWVVGAKLWLIVGGGDKIMAGRGWSHDLLMPVFFSVNAGY